MSIVKQRARQTAGGYSASLRPILLLTVALRLSLAFYLGNDTRNWLGGVENEERGTENC